MDKYRILQVDPDTFCVQQRGIFWGWNSAAYVSLMEEPFWICFSSETKALEWLDNELDRQKEAAEKAAFKPRVIEL